MNDYQIKTVKDLNTAERVWEMFLTPNIIGPLSEGEKEQFRKNIEATIKNPKGAFFYIGGAEKNIIGAIGAWENSIKNGGFVIEHFAVVEELRGRGIGSRLFDQAERFIKKFNPRYTTIETGDDDFYEKGRKLYEKYGYKKVSHFPYYFAETSGRVDYMKTFKKKK